MTIQHSAITNDADLHEPKGIGSADLDTVYVANGSSSGVWKYAPGKAHAELVITGGTATHTLAGSSAYSIINPGNWTASGHEEHITVDTTNGDVDLFLGFDTGVLADDCASCNQYISTTTTQTPTTTQAPCKAISASVTTIALNACCGSKSTTIYINANNILLASVIYTNSSCTTVLPAGNYINTGGRLYFWTGNTLVEQDCPQCP